MTTSTSNGRHEPRVDVRRERAFRPVEPGAFHVLTRISAPLVAIPDRERPPLDLAFVVDRSGSMAGGKLDLARKGVEHALRLLDNRDTVSLVIYDDQIETLLGQRPFDRAAHSEATRRLARVQPRGSTDLAGGWLAGCQEVAPIADGARIVRESAAKPICRAMLLSDGLANVGMSDPAEIATHAAELFRRGISTTTLGVGDDYDENLLARMADVSGGHFHHIADASRIPDVFAGELGEMLQVALRDASLALRVPESWTVHLLNDLPVERADGWIVLHLGELASGEQRALVWAIELPEVDHGRREEIEIRVRWRDQEGVHWFEQTDSHTLEASLDAGELDEQVQDAIAEQLGARARDEALQLNRAGDYAGVARLLDRYAAAMPQTVAAQSIAYDLREAAPAMAQPASPGYIKQQLARSRNARRSRKDYAE